MDLFSSQPRMLVHVLPVDEITHAIYLFNFFGRTHTSTQRQQSNFDGLGFGLCFFFVLGWVVLGCVWLATFLLPVKRAT